jgi:hypothetical protein
MTKRSSLGPLENRTHLSGFQMVGRHFVFTIRKPDRNFLTSSLDHFVIKNIFFMTFFFIKWSRLATIRKPDHLTIGQELNPVKPDGLDFGC